MEPKQEFNCQHCSVTKLKVNIDILTTDKPIGAGLGSVESTLRTRLEGLPCARLLCVHGVNGAGSQGLWFTHVGIFGGGQLWGEGSYRSCRWSVLFGG